MQPPPLLQDCPTACRALVWAQEPCFHQVPVCSCLEVPALALQGQAGASSSWARRARGTSPAPAQPVTALQNAAIWGCLEKRCASTLTFLEQGHHTL